MALNITTGVSIPVTRDDKEVGVLHFNPNDVAFSEKVYDLIGELDAADREYHQKATALEADTTLDGYGLPKNQRERLALLRNICETMHTKIDEVFGAGTSEMVFGGALDLDAIWQFFEYLHCPRDGRGPEGSDQEVHPAQRKPGTASGAA